MDPDDRDTLPPSELELTRVSDFEQAITRDGENDARLAELERLRPFWDLIDD